MPSCVQQCSDQVFEVRKRCPARKPAGGELRVAPSLLLSKFSAFAFYDQVYTEYKLVLNERPAHRYSRPRQGGVRSLFGDPAQGGRPELGRASARHHSAHCYYCCCAAAVVLHKETNQPVFCLKRYPKIVVTLEAPHAFVSLHYSRGTFYPTLWKAHLLNSCPEGRKTPDALSRAW